jgi:hypothetical protein
MNCVPVRSSAETRPGEIGFGDVCPVEVRLAEVCVTEVWNDFMMVRPPCVPTLALADYRDVFIVGEYRCKEISNFRKCPQANRP